MLLNQWCRDGFQGNTKKKKKENICFAFSNPKFVCVCSVVQCASILQAMEYLHVGDTEKRFSLIGNDFLVLFILRVAHLNTLNKQTNLIQCFCYIDEHQDISPRTVQRSKLLNTRKVCLFAQNTFHRLSVMVTAGRFWVLSTYST